MIKLELSPEDAQTLASVLSSYVSDLRMEIANTDSKDFRDDLKKKETLLKEIVARLGGKVA